MSSEYDEFKWCRVCRRELTEIEIEKHRELKMPALCEIHLPFIQEKLKICLPLFAKMNF